MIVKKRQNIATSLLTIFILIFCMYSISGGQSWEDKKNEEVKARIGKKYWILPNREMSFHNLPDALKATESFFITETESFVIQEWIPNKIPEMLFAGSWYQIKFESGKISYVKIYYFENPTIYIKTSAEDLETVEEKQRKIEEQQKEEREKREERFNASREINGNGFQDIPFGAAYDDVLAELIQRGDKGDIQGQSQSISDFIVINNFPLGDNTVTIFFQFDHKKDFYSFSFHTKKLTANKFDTQVLSDANNLTQVFKNKYGKPAECFEPNFLFIKEGYISFACKWHHNDFKIFTGISVYESRYYAIGEVTSKKMEAGFESYKKQQEQKKAAEDAKKF